MKDETVQRMAALASLYIAFLPLLWSWIRGALTVVQKVGDGELDELRWGLIMELAPCLTLGFLLLLVTSWVALLCTGGHPLWLVIAVGLLAVIFHGFLGYTVIYVWQTLRDEFDLTLNRREG